MGWLTSFFSWLWGMIKNTFNFITSIYAQLTVAFATIISTVVSVKATLSSGSSYIQSLNSVGSSAVSGVSNIFASKADALNIAIRSLSLDVLFNAVLSFVTIFLSLFVVLVTFICVTIPLYIAAIYVIKTSAWAIVSVLPAGWCPQGLLRLTRINSNLAKVVFESFTKSFKHLKLY